MVDIYSPDPAPTSIQHVASPTAGHYIPPLEIPAIAPNRLELLAWMPYLID